MRTLTPEEFKKQYGEQGLAAFDKLPKPGTVPLTLANNPAQKGYLERVTDSVGADIDKRVERTGEILNRDTDIVTKGAQLFGQGAGMAANTIEQTVLQAPVVKDIVGAIGKGFNWLGETSPVKYVADKLSNSKSLQDLVSTYDNDPNFKDSVDAFANIARLALDTNMAVKGGTAATNKVIGTEPTITVAGRTFTPKQLHTAEGTKFVDALKGADRDAVVAFDSHYSALDMLKRAQKAGDPDLAPLIQEAQTKFTLPQGSTATLGNNGLISQAGRGVSRASEFVAEKGKSAFDALSNKTAGVTKYPKEFLDKITLKEIDPQTQTILKEIPVEKFDRYVEAGMKAKADPRALTPLEKAGVTAKNTVKVIKDDMSNIGRQKGATLDSVGNVKVPDVAISQIDKLKPLLQKNLTDAERNFVLKYMDELKTLGQTPSAKSVDALVDKMQATFYETGGAGAVPVTTRVKAAINQSIGEINKALKTTVDDALGSTDYSTLNSAYATRVKLFDVLNKALGKGGLKGGSLIKRFFSPQDAGIKTLFNEIRQIYGIDLGQDATVARFVMETLGDTRARSLLQLPPTTATGAIGKVLDAVERSLTSPEKVLSKARSMVPKPAKL